MGLAGGNSMGRQFVVDYRVPTGYPRSLAGGADRYARSRLGIRGGAASRRMGI